MRVIKGLLREVEESDLDLLKSNPKKFWKGVKSISGGAFSDLKSIEEIIIPNAIKNIYPCCFSGCSNLKCINLPSGIKEICNNTFAYTSLNEITIPDGVKIIREDA